MEKAAKATLRYLFQEYLKGPAIQYSINPVTDNYQVSAVLVSDFLLEKNWIRERWVYMNHLVSCRITVAGIEEVNPVFINTKLRQIVRGLAGAGGTRDLMDIFQNKIEEHAIALDIVNQLEKLEMAKLHYQAGKIHVELTEYGWKYLSRKGKFLFSMMAVA